MADYASVFALGDLLTQHDPPTALAIGYCLTSAGLVVAIMGYVRGLFSGL